MSAEGGNQARPAIPESLVVRLWETQRDLSPPLRTVQGDEIQVVYPGRRRWGRGPDFVGALISWPGSVLRGGEVEAHVRSSDWRAHGHHRDRHYNGVGLQVVMWHDDHGPTLRQDGVEVPVLALADHLALPLAELMTHLQDPAPRPSPCWSEGRIDLGGLLERCGVERFAAKAGRFESDLACCPPEQILYEGVAEGLGYTQNRRPFRRLAELVPLEVARAFAGRGDGDAGTRDGQDGQIGPVGSGGRDGRDGRGGGTTEGWGDAGEGGAAAELGGAAFDLEGLMLGAAGLLPSQRGMGPSDGYAEGLERLWARRGRERVGGVMLPSEWEFFRVRPANFPTRRVASFARLAVRWPDQGLVDVLVRLILGLEPRLVPRAMEGLLLGDARGGYWSARCDFGLPMRRPAGMIGRQRAAEIAVNLFLPFLAGLAAHVGDEGLGRRALDGYRAYPKRGDNEISRYMAVQIVGAPRPREARSACRQQGLLHLYRRYCEARRCGECPVGLR